MGLKEATAEKHKLAERMPFNGRMFRGELSKKEYLHYLNQQASIFQIIELNGVPHKSLLRLKNVFEDIQELAKEVKDTLPILKSMERYGVYLQKLTYEQILPHIYLHYLALMFGGQMMKSKVPGSGRMYDFDDMMEAAGSIRAVQKDEWADEVNKAFDFMIEIFDELERLHNPAK
jgi:heme oxygenase